MSRAGLVGVALAGLLCLGAAASDPAERLHDPVQEARARTLFREIRCVQCQNESIDESEAPLADDLRRIVRDQIAAGRTDEEIRAFLVRRYGEFMLLQPSFSPANAVLWLTPFAIVGVGVATIALRRRPGLPLEPPLEPAEQARLREVLRQGAVTPASHAATVPPQPRLTDDSRA